MAPAGIIIAVTIIAAEPSDRGRKGLAQAGPFYFDMQAQSGNAATVMA
jgi:hypothetical protein